MKKKYRALRTVAFIMQAFAWLALVLAILGGIGGLVAGILGWVSIPAIEGLGSGNITLVRVITGVITGVAIVVVGVINFIALLAGAETIYATLNIEENTRASADYLQRLLQTQIPPQPPATPLDQPDSYTGGETITQDTPAA